MAISQKKRLPSSCIILILLTEQYILRTMYLHALDTTPRCQNARSCVPTATARGWLHEVLICIENEWKIGCRVIFAINELTLI